MVRKLALVLAWLAATLPGGANALGLGDIQLNSFLNQPLDAEIEILSSIRGETDGLKVGLASDESFKRAGLELTNNLRKLRFKLVTKPNGSEVIKVTTRKGYREPFLNFLLEVNWANGRILREYAALVDPPSMVQSSPVQTSSQAVAQAAPTPSRPAAQQPAQERLFGAPTTTRSSDRGTIGAGDTYRTQRNDTAWKIAQNVKPDDAVSVEQAMMAILRNNPQAFMGQNINRLKAGYVLNIPDRQEMLSQSQGEAVAEVRQQNREWRNRTQAPEPSARKGRLEILPPQAAADNAEQVAGATAGDDAHREAMLAREAAEAQRQENAELRMRVSELEEQIDNYKKLANLKSDQLAALEKKLSELNAQADSSDAAMAEAVKQSEEKIAQAEEKAAATPDETAETKPEAAAEEAEAAAETAETAEEPKPAKKPVEEAKPAAPGTPLNAQQVEGFKRVDPATLPKSDLPKTPFKTKAPKSAPAEAPEPKTLLDEMIDMTGGDPLIFWVIVGAGGLVILLIILMLVRRNRDDQFEESILQEHITDQNEDMDTSAPAAGAADQAAEGDSFFESIDAEEKPDAAKPDVTDTSFLSDMVLSDMSDIDGSKGESDPLTEADVFLAYGRFGPAENLIKGAIANEPDRNDLKLKLLEIYYSAKNKESFASEAESLHKQLQETPDEETWEKVVEMGCDLCPENPLFTSGAAEPAPVAEPAADDEEDTSIMDFDLGEFEDQIEDMEGEQKSKQNQVEEDDFGLDLDLDSLAGDDTAGDEDTMEITTELEGIADALGEVEPEKSADNETTQELDTGESLDITQELETPSSANDEITQELEVPDLTDDIKQADSSESLEDLDLDDDALADIDEVGTKLDLARAYIDMGDPEGARSILNEVVEEGNDEQKGEAEQLLKQI